LELFLFLRVLGYDGGLRLLDVGVFSWAGGLPIFMQWWDGRRSWFSIPRGISFLPLERLYLDLSPGNGYD